MLQDIKTKFLSENNSYYKDYIKALFNRAKLII